MKTEQDSGLPLADLDNDILPLFREANFPDVEYSVLETMLRLASLLVQVSLDQPDSVPMRIVTGTKHLIALPEFVLEPDGTWSQQFAYPQPQAAKQAANKRLASNALTRLADLVKFVADDECETGGGTKCISPPDGFLSHDPNEYHSTISYSSKAYNDLRRYSKSGTGGDPAYVTVLTFELAATLSHEAMHALTFSQRNDDIPPVYFSADAREAPIAEIGFEFDQRLYGGCIERLYKDKDTLLYEYPNGKKSAVQGVVVMWRSPHYGNVTHYEHHGMPIGCRKAYANPVFKPELAFRVTIQHLSKYLTKAFWEQEYRRRGLIALQPPKLVGHFFVNEEDECRPWWLSYDEEVAHLPMGFWSTVTFDIVPE